MGAPTFPPPVKLLVALLATDSAQLALATTRLESSYGTIDVESNIFAWDTTNYYREEMGEKLLRKFVAFAPLISPEALAPLKLETNALEILFAGDSSPAARRCVNLDPGYLDATKLVLASTKNQAHRIYLSQGIYAEVTLLYHHGGFHPFIYTYTDYRWPETHEFLRRVRKRYLEQLRVTSPSSGR